MKVADNLLLRCEEAIARAERLHAENELLKRQASELMAVHNARVARNLQLLAAVTYQRRHRAPDAVRPFADHAAAHMQTMALLHRRVADGQEAIGVRDYLSEVCANLPVPEASDPNIRLRLSGEGFVLAPDPALALGLIASELVMNSYRFAFRQRRGGEVRLDIRRHASDRAHLTVADSGPGLGPLFRKGAGMAIVEALAESIGGDVLYQTGEQGSVRVNFTAPALETA